MPLLGPTSSKERNSTVSRLPTAVVFLPPHRGSRRVNRRLAHRVQLSAYLARSSEEGVACRLKSIANRVVLATYSVLLCSTEQGIPYVYIAHAPLCSSIASFCSQLHTLIRSIHSYAFHFVDSVNQEPTLDRALAKRFITPGRTRICPTL